MSAAPPGASVPWRAFWMGGFEGADHVNCHGVALDMVRATGHWDQLEADYARTAALGIGAVRESLGWRLAEPSPGRFDFSRARRMARAAEAHGLQVLWTFMHYGTPPDVSLLDDRLIERFAAFARAAAQVLGDLSGTAPVYNLVNEIGFLAWAVSATDMVYPYAGDGSGEGERTLASGWRIKCRLVQAVLVARAAVLEVDPRARFLHVEPLVHTVPPAGRPDLQPLADQIAGYQWQVWDLIEGRLEPQLGGCRAALDLLGVNHYHSGQWEVGTGKRLRWHENVAARDPRRVPFGTLLTAAWQRYRRSLLVAETSHIGEGRAAWLHEHASEVRRVRRRGVPVHGLCLYPLLDRGDWDAVPGAPPHWHRSGLWDAIGPGAGQARALHAGYAAALQAWQPHLSEPNAISHPPPGSDMPALVVFSHLRWGFVYQRPQQLLERLAQHHRIVFIEEPLHDPAGPARLARFAQGPNLEVLTPCTPLSAPGFHDDHLPMLEPLIGAYLRDEGLDDYLVWFYTPMALPLIATLRPRAVVYDCMDELSAFRHAPKQLRQRESALMKRASIVFTGGPALYEAKRTLHPKVVCLPSSVDAAHYAPARLAAHPFEAAEASALQARIPAPRLGYFGVIDERLDLGLLAELAAARPDWQLVMVGPVAKIDPARLPRAANLHWLGQQPYARLPHLVAGWDLCLMPFALNEATRFISPTKTLEYLAGEKPVVSTPVRDVVALYGDAVAIAGGAPAFIAACERLLNEHGEARAVRQRAMADAVHRSSWDQAAQTVLRCLCETLAEQPTSLAAPRELAEPVFTSERPLGRAVSPAEGVALSCETTEAPDLPWPRPTPGGAVQAGVAR